MQVEWNNSRDPTKGFKYLFLSDADYTSIAARADTAVLKAEPFFAENGGCGNFVLDVHHRRCCWQGQSAYLMRNAQMSQENSALGQCILQQRCCCVVAGW